MGGHQQSKKRNPAENGVGSCGGCVLSRASSITMRHEQKPGLASHWASAASAGFRMLSAPLIELVSNEYIVGRSDAERAIGTNKYPSS